MDIRTLRRIYTYLKVFLFLFVPVTYIYINYIHFPDSWVAEQEMLLKMKKITAMKEMQQKQIKMDKLKNQKQEEIVLHPNLAQNSVDDALHQNNNGADWQKKIDEIRDRLHHRRHSEKLKNLGDDNVAVNNLKVEVDNNQLVGNGKDDVKVVDGNANGDNHFDNNEENIENSQGNIINNQENIQNDEDNIQNDEENMQNNVENDQENIQNNVEHGQENIQNDFENDQENAQNDVDNDQENIQNDFEHDQENIHNDEVDVANDQENIQNDVENDQENIQNDVEHDQENIQNVQDDVENDQENKDNDHENGMKDSHSNIEHFDSAGVNHMNSDNVNIENNNEKINENINVNIVEKNKENIEKNENNNDIVEDHNKNINENIDANIDIRDDNIAHFNPDNPPPDNNVNQDGEQHILHRNFEQEPGGRKILNLDSTTILDLDKIPFLPNYRNPCWLEPLPDTNPYKTNRYGGKKNGYMSNLDPAWNRLYSKLTLFGKRERLRCLPYFFIGGFPKCGTTDVYEKLTQHPQITGCLFKEPHYWTRWRFWTDKCFYGEFLCSDGSRCMSEGVRCDGRIQCKDGSDEENCELPHACEMTNGGCSHFCQKTPEGVAFCSCPRGYKLKRDHKTCIGGTPLQDYVDLFDTAADVINNTAEARSTADAGVIQYHPIVTGEATPATFWDNHRWHDEPSNDGNATEPYILTAHVITHVLPNVKVIVMVRNPTQRLYSDMLYFFPHCTPEHFHEKVKEGVTWFNDCIQNHTLRSCLFQPMAEERPPEGRYWQPVERLRIGLYSEYLKEWLKIVPLSQIMVVRLEDYSAQRAEVLRNITTFLQLEQMPQEMMYRWEMATHKNSGQKKYDRQGHMLAETVQLLNTFYSPFNKNLADILQDDKFNYNLQVT